MANLLPNIRLAADADRRDDPFCRVILKFGFANVLRKMGWPARALGWSLFAFNVGVEIDQVVFWFVQRCSFSGGAI